MTSNRDAMGRFLPGNKVSPGRKKLPDEFKARAKVLADEALERLARRDEAEVEEEFVPEAAVDEVPRGVLGASDVEVHVLPIADCFFRNEGVVVARVHVAEVVGT